jgi:hypothetical protein
MIDLAISIDENRRGDTIVETNHGDRMAAPDWPQDSDSRLVAFSPSARSCEVVWPQEMASDIALALQALEPVISRQRKKPEWYRRLKKYAAGASDC